MKRLTDTEKWNKPWFRKLPPRLKCLWNYLCDRVNAVGIITPDWEVASLFIGEKVSENDLEHFTDQVVKREDGHLFLPDFLTFQYKTLSYDSPAHREIFVLIKKYGIKVTVPIAGRPSSPNAEPVMPRATVAGNGNGTINAFNRFWAAYPRKIKRHETERVFVEVHAEDHTDEILAALSWQVNSESWTKDNGRYVPAPDRYLNDGRWHDQQQPSPGAYVRGNRMTDEEIEAADRKKLDDALKADRESKKRAAQQQPRPPQPPPA